MRKFLVFIFIVALVVTGITVSARKNPERRTDVPEQAPADKPIVSLSIDDGEFISTYSGIAAQTAYDALVAVAGANNIPIRTKQYDFGVLVEGIGNVISASGYAWIYFVNDRAATISADTQSLDTGDTVSWRFMKPL